MEFIPALLSEEFASGYIGRIRQIQSRSQSTSSFRVLDYKSDKCVNKEARLRLWASTAMSQVEPFVRSHTLIPLDHAFASVRCGRSYSNWSESMPKSCDITKSSICYQCCPICMEGDFNYLGLTYWRRFHQIHGIESCPVHSEISLVEIFTIDKLPSCPHHYVPLHQMVVRHPNVCLGPGESFERRYSDICLKLLQLDRPLGRYALQLAIKERSRVLGLVQKGSLMQYVRDVSPNGWLQRHFPRVADAYIDRHFDKALKSVHDLLLRRLAVLVCAAIYSSAEEAIGAITKNVTPSTLRFNP